MRIFTCLFEDQRYSAPTLSFFLTEDEDRARELAWRALRTNPNYLGFDITEGERRITAQPEVAQ